MNEDFYLILGQVPAQKEAIDYLETILKMKNSDGQKVYVGGHSKGGNLAECAATSVSEQYQNQILQVFNESFSGWIYGLDADEQKAFIDDFFAVLEAPGLDHISDLMSGGLLVLSKMAQRLAKLDPDSKDIIVKLIVILLENMGERAKEAFMKMMA